MFSNSKLFLLAGRKDSGRKPVYLLGLAFILLFSLMSPQSAVSREGTIVKGIVFHKLDCTNCTALLREVLPELKQQFGDGLIMLAVNNADSTGSNLYLTTLLEMNIPITQPLPLLIIGDSYWSDPETIKKDLPDIIEKALQKEGIDWPEISELEALLQHISELDENEQKNWWISGEFNELQFLLSGFSNKYHQDPRGNRYAVVVLICLIICMAVAFYLFFNTRQTETTRSYRVIVLAFLLVGFVVGWQLAEMSTILTLKKEPAGSFEDLLTLIVFSGMLISLVYSFWSFSGLSTGGIEKWQFRIVPILSIIIITAAGYLLYSELANVEAQCGAVGDCNAVQQSPYALLFGWISVAGFGLTGIFFVIVTWLLHYFGPEHRRSLFGVAMWLALLVGVLFFAYLTFLEPFVIGATCFWCLSAAIAMALVFFILTPVAGQSWKKLVHST